jgi:hypothetical protein
MVKKNISKKAGRGSEQFQLRLPDGMRKHLAVVAEREGRSMNAVIVTALAIYFESEDASPGSKGYRFIKDIVDQLANQHQELVQLIKGDAGEGGKEERKIK